MLNFLLTVFWFLWFIWRPIGGVGDWRISGYWSWFFAPLPGHAETTGRGQEVSPTFPFPLQTLHCVYCQCRGGTVGKLNKCSFVNPYLLFVIQDMWKDTNGKTSQLTQFLRHFKFSLILIHHNSFLLYLHGPDSRTTTTHLKGFCLSIFITTVNIATWDFNYLAIKSKEVACGQWDAHFKVNRPCRLPTYSLNLNIIFILIAAPSHWCHGQFGATSHIKWWRGTDFYNGWTTMSEKCSSNVWVGNYTALSV